MFEILQNPIIEWLNDYASQGVFITDADLVVCGWNRWLEQRSGREAKEVKGLSLFDAFPEIAARGLDRFYRGALNGHAQVLANRFHDYLIILPTDFETPAGRMRQTVRIAPLSRDGTVVGTITVIEDVTERTVREQELSVAREAAESANRAKDKLLATLSHDLRTSLSSILGWVDVIRRCHTFDEALPARGLTSIKNNAVVQVQLIDAILDTSRIASGKIELSRDETDLADVIEKSIDGVTPMAQAKNIRIEKTIPLDSRSCILDAKRLHQIVWNLLSNAIKFTPDGGEIQVELSFCGDRVQVKVKDSGMGIAPEDLARVFEPLWQSDRAGGHGGLGLGLSIAKHLVELHGGSMRVDSAGYGKGATFIVDLPQAAGNPVEQPLRADWF